MRLRNVHFFLPLQHSAVDFAGECHVGHLGLALLKLYATVSHEGKSMINSKTRAAFTGAEPATRTASVSALISARIGESQRNKSNAASAIHAKD